MQLSIHIIEDTEAYLYGVERALRKASGTILDKVSREAVDLQVAGFSGPAAWKQHCQRAGAEGLPDLCLVDIAMGGDDEAGLKLAQSIRQDFPQIIVVMYSHSDDADTVLKLMAAGADSFISKRSSFEDLPHELLHAYRASLLRRPAMPVTASERSELCTGATLEAIASRVPFILNSAIRAVHVEGETGTGKEVVADLFEAFLKRCSLKTPFLRFNCAALSPHLVESELLGHKRGAFTGAESDRVGLIEAAHGGWLFLDEVASLSPHAQSVLLRVIENQAFLRVGETKERRISVRFLSACNEALEAKVASGTFRGDLWQRLTETRLTLPPLRERMGEIEPLVRHFSRIQDGGPYEVTPPALELLKRYDWRAGNVRELRNCLRAMTEYASSTTLGPNTIPPHVFASILGMRAMPPIHTVSFQLTQDSCRLERMETRLFVETIRFLMKQSSKHSLRTLELATGLSRTTLSARLRNAVQAGHLTSGDFVVGFWERNLGRTRLPKQAPSRARERRDRGQISQ